MRQIACSFVISDAALTNARAARRGRRQTCAQRASRRTVFTAAIAATATTTSVERFSRKPLIGVAVSAKAATGGTRRSVSPHCRWIIIATVAAPWQAVGRPQRVRNLMSPHASTLYALWLIGAVDLRADKDDTQKSLPGVGPAAAVAELEAKLRNAAASFEGASHYEVLGIPGDSRDKDVRAKHKSGGNVAAAKEVGGLVASRANQKGIELVVFDRGGFQYHGRIKALADAAREAGLKF